MSGARSGLPGQWRRDADLQKALVAPRFKCPLLEELASSRPTIWASDVAVVVAHPDDETLGCGAQLPRLRGCTVILVTDGAPCDPWYAERQGFPGRKAYAQAREQESRAALSLAGVPQRNAVLMNIPDQEAAYRLAQIASSLAQQFAMRGTRYVLTHCYEGGHPDHDAVAFAVHLAAARLADRGSQIDVIEMPFYRMDSTGKVFQSFTENEGTDQLRLDMRRSSGAEK
jgi:N-acetylglucosamine malate deacetylase 2